MDILKMYHEKYNIIQITQKEKMHNKKYKRINQAFQDNSKLNLFNMAGSNLKKCQKRSN